MCARVDDPRDYCVVNVDGNGYAIDFTEKPGWSDSYSNIAGCGVYILNHSVLEEIEEDSSCDFTKELFPRLLKNGSKLYAYISNDYWHHIKEIEDYKKVQFDILSRRAKKNLPYVAEGIFTKSNVPNGNFVIIPPVFFGENVQVESGAVIGPFVIIGEGSLVSKGSKIRESILLKSVYVSSGCSVNGALLCEGVSVKKGASLFEECVVGQDSVIGADSVIANSVLIWPNKIIENSSTITENVKYSQPVNSILQINDVIFGDFGVELTPEKTARLGAAIGTLFDGIRVGIGIDGETNSLALKCGVLGGLMSVGAKSFDFGKCFYSQMFYYSAFCDVDIAIFINGGNSGVSLVLCEKGGVALSREKARQLEMILKRNEFNRCAGGDCQSVSVMNSIENMYLNEICSQFDSKKIDFGILLICGNPFISQVVSEATGRLGIEKENDAFIIKVNDIGTRVTIVEKNESFPHEKILAVVAHNELKKGNDVALPWDAPQIITSLANSLGRKALRLSGYSTFYDESKLQSTSTNQIWARDAVLLMFKLINIINDEGRTLKQLVKELPEFYVAKKVMEIDVSPSLISKELLDNDFEFNEENCAVIKNEKGTARVRSDGNGKSLKIIAEAVNSELAEELCADIEKLISIDIDL